MSLMATNKLASFARLICVSLALFHLTRLATAAPPVVGIEKRASWSTSKIVGSPDRPLPYVTERVFPSLKFDKCLDISNAPGSERLFIVEQGGKIFSFPNRADVAKADLVVDMAKAVPGVKAVYAITFHPQFEKNGYCFICYIKNRNVEDGTHVARFRMTDSDPPTIDASSEKTIITWISGGHNGCCLRFGPDGCLYISTGDAAPPNPPDAKKAGQDITNLLSAILRVDVDHADGKRNYRIPADNPFVDLKGARGEIWAYGFRNPWRMSFDRKTGDLWVGDVGWELWELLDRVERGGNYGWSVMEGRQPTNPEWARGPTPILPPTIDHPHSESSSITDGLTYYGSRLRELNGNHIYGDYDTGKFWGFRFEKGRVIEHRELADTTHRVVAFGEDNDGEFYVLDHTAGTIHRLVANQQTNQAGKFPRKLSETGLFSSTRKQLPAAGVIPYSINAQPWADYAIAERFVAVPETLSAKPTKKAWQFPKGSVLVKTLSLANESHGLDQPSSLRRVETQILHFDGLEWRPYSYRWNDAQSDATLVLASGAEQIIDIKDAAAPGGRRNQTWRFSGRAECQRCHNKWSGPVLAFNTPQLNKLHDYGGVRALQLETFAHIGLIDKPIAVKNRPQLADPHDSGSKINGRARAYLQVNCAHCHRLHAGSAVLSKMSYDMPLEKTDMVGVRPTQGTFGIHAAQVIAPGDPFRSVLLYRMSKLGGGRMPHIGSTEVDLYGLNLITEWLRHLPKETARDKTGNETAASLRKGESASLEHLRIATNLNAKTTLVEKLLSSTSGALLLLRSIDEKALPEAAASLAIEHGTRHVDVRVRDLFERFLPSEKRVKRLGSVVRPDQILSLQGDPARGRRIFFNTDGVQCKSCHRIGKEGKEVGPDLTTIGKKYKKQELLENILDPSKRIDPKYVTYLIETTEGRLLTGLLVKKDANAVVIKDAQNKTIRVPSKQIEQFVRQQKSLMPDLLVRDMTAEQVADLLAYLGSLK